MCHTKEKCLRSLTRQSPTALINYSTRYLNVTSNHDDMQPWQQRLTKTGIGSYLDSKSVSMAYRAALELAVSNIVSTIRTSTPPSRRPLACSE